MRLQQVPRLGTGGGLAPLDLALGAVTEAVLLANNPRLDAAALARLALRDDSLLVQFNDPLFDAVLAERPGRRLYCATHHRLSFFGFPEGRPRQPLLARPGPPPLFVFCGRDLARVEPFLADLPPAVGCFQVETTRLLLPDYPRGRAPSTGFLAARLLLAVNELRRARGAPPLRLRLVGFTGYRKGAVPLHDWWLERRWLRRQPGLQMDEGGTREPGHAWRAAGWMLLSWRSRLRGRMARWRGRQDR